MLPIERFACSLLAFRREKKPPFFIDLSHLAWSVLFPTEMKEFYDPLPFLAYCFAIADDCGYITHALKSTLNGLAFRCSAGENEFRNVITEKESLLKEYKKNCPSSASHSPTLDEDTPFSMQDYTLLLSIVGLLTSIADNVVFAIISRHYVDEKVSTFGFSAASSDEVQDILQKINDFARVIQDLGASKTSYVVVRIRGRHDSNIENLYSALVMAIALHVCKLSKFIEIETLLHSTMPVQQDKVVALLKPAITPTAPTEHDFLKRVILIGDTRAGKSTVGNAFISRQYEEQFRTSDGTTGTLSIERRERMDVIDNKIHITEVYDTPGLNDVNGLDMLYAANIEDTIRSIQLVSSYVMAVSADEGVKNAMFQAMQNYKELFGESMGKKLIVLLTVNKPADEKALKHRINLNKTYIKKMDKDIPMDRVFCVSLHDLRDPSQNWSFSHQIIERIANECRDMRLELVETIRKELEALQANIKKKVSMVEERLGYVINSGWLAFNDLVNEYEESEFTKMTTLVTGFFNGFAMKKATKMSKLTAVASLGLLNPRSKTALHVFAMNERAMKAYINFMNKNERRSRHSGLLAEFSKFLKDEKFSVSVKPLRTLRNGTIRLRRFSITILDAENEKLRDLVKHLTSILSEEEKEAIADGLVKMELS